METEVLALACSRLDRAIYRNNGIDFNPTGQSPEAQLIGRVYGWCQRLLEKGKAAISGKTVSVEREAPQYEELLKLVEKAIEVEPTKIDLRSLLNAGQEVCGILQEAT